MLANEISSVYWGSNSNSKNLEIFIFNPTNIDYIVKKNDILVVIGYKITVTQLKSDLLNLDFRV